MHFVPLHAFILPTALFSTPRKPMAINVYDTTKYGHEVVHDIWWDQNSLKFTDINVCLFMVQNILSNPPLYMPTVEIGDDSEMSYDAPLIFLHACSSVKDLSIDLKVFLLCQIIYVLK